VGRRRHLAPPRVPRDVLAPAQHPYRHHRCLCLPTPLSRSPSFHGLDHLTLPFRTGSPCLGDGRAPRARNARQTEPGGSGKCSTEVCLGKSKWRRLQPRATNETVALRRLTRSCRRTQVAAHSRGADPALRGPVAGVIHPRWSPQQIADGRRSHSETIRSASCAGGSSGGRMGRRELRWMVVALAACTLAAACDGSAGETGKWDGGPAWNCQRG